MGEFDHSEAVLFSSELLDNLFPCLGVLFDSPGIDNSFQMTASWATNESLPFEQGNFTYSNPLSRSSSFPISSILASISAPSSRLIPIDVARLTEKSWDWSNCLILFVRSPSMFGLAFLEETATSRRPSDFLGWIAIFPDYAARIRQFQDRILPAPIIRHALPNETSPSTHDTDPNRTKNVPDSEAIWDVNLNSPPPKTAPN